MATSSEDLVAAAAIGLAAVDGDGRYVTINPALGDVLGRSEAELVGSAVTDSVVREDRDRVAAELRRVAAGQADGFQLRHRIWQASGEVRWVEVTSRALPGPDGRPGAVHAVIDVTDSGRHEREVRQLSSEVRWANETLQQTIEHAAVNEGRYRALVDHLPDTAVYVFDRDHRITLACGAGPLERGFSEEALLGKRPEDAVGAEDAQAIHGMLDAAFEGRPISTEITVGSTGLDNLVDAVPLDPTRPGGPVEVMVVGRDITDRKVKERALHAAERRYAALVEHSYDMITISDGAGNLTYASPALTAVTGRRPDELVRFNTHDLIHPEDRERVVSALEGLVGEPGAVTTYLCRLEHIDGTYRHVETVVANRLHDPAVRGIVANTRDMTERVQAAEMFAHQAMHDPLTELPNRALFLDRLDQALTRNQRDPHSCAVLFIDLDRFKRINDSLGHAAGDQVLITVAERIQHAVRPADTVARLGGDEFVVLAENMGSAGVAHEIAERLREAITAPIDVDDQVVTVGCSVGIALSDRHRPEGLVQEADIALYRAKERGRNRSELYDTAMQTQARVRLQSEQIIRAALEQERVAVVHQPIIDLTTGLVTATEALARIEVGRDTLLGAPDFIPVAEDTGLIVPLGEAVLDKAVAQQARWMQAGQPPERVSVNVSARQLLSSRLVERVAASLEAHALPAGQLCLELTESALIDAGPSMRRNIDDLKKLGVTLALDDFGTGWSSLAYLRRFPIDMVKIDRSFVTGLGTDDEDTELVRAVISLGHALHLTTVAEGVEEALHERLLMEMGCDHAQGYRYGRPGRADEIDLDGAEFAQLRLA